jgi:hypothetical protein
MDTNTPADGEGVRALRSRNRRIRNLVLAVFAGAAAIDAMIFVMARNSAEGQSVLPPLGAALTALLAFLLINVGTWFGLRFADELDYRNNLLACTVAFLFNTSAYVAWMLLELGELVPSFDGHFLFFSTCGVFLLAYLWMKFR